MNFSTSMAEIAQITLADVYIVRHYLQSLRLKVRTENI